MALETIFFANPNQPYGPFTALLGEYALGNLTSAQVKSYAEEITGTMTADQVTDFNSIISDIDAETGTEAKFAIIETLENVLTLSMYNGMTCYAGAAGLKTRMGWV